MSAMFETQAAYSPENQQLVKGATFTAHDVDSGETLPTMDSLGSAMTLMSDLNGFLPPFKVAGDRTQVEIRNGAFKTIITTVAGTVDQGVIRAITEDGPAKDALSATIAEVAAAEVSNPETALNGAVLALAESVAPSGLVIIVGTDPNTPRENSAGNPFTGPALWLLPVTPANIVTGDIWLPVSEEIIEFPDTLGADLLSWWDPSIHTISTGADLATVADQAGSHTLTPLTGTDMNDIPQYGATALNGTPGMVFPAISGLKAAATPFGAGALTLAMTARFPNLSGGTQTLSNIVSASDTLHQFSIFRTESGGSPGAWGFRRGGTNVTGGTADANEHTFIAVFDGASSKLYVDGVQIATGNVGAADVSSFALGTRNTARGSIVSDAAMNGGIIGDVMIINGAADASRVAAAHAWLAERAGM